MKRYVVLLTEAERGDLRSCAAIEADSGENHGPSLEPALHRLDEGAHRGMMDLVALLHETATTLALEAQNYPNQPHWHSLARHAARLERAAKKLEGGAK